MFGMGLPEILLIMALALIVIGPKKLPELAKSLGSMLGEFKRAATELKGAIDIDSELTEVKKDFDNINNDFKKAAEADTKAQTDSEESKHKTTDSGQPDDLYKPENKDHESAQNNDNLKGTEKNA
jgi:sec-independent protein translocase protein TatB